MPASIDPEEIASKMRPRARYHDSRYWVDVDVHAQIQTTLEFVRALGVALDVDPLRELHLADVRCVFDEDAVMANGAPIGSLLDVAVLVGEPVGSNEVGVDRVATPYRSEGKGPQARVVPLTKEQLDRLRKTPEWQALRSLKQEWFDRIMRSE
ncbi:hypothetical protein LZC95_08240 [Pendulispora brunnea]|uniref:Uncharacterized protein n=1 Tax=Pendulispora brunnea TaxID=2905690 RepID=A0ABZ2KDR8_9BACT